MATIKARKGAGAFRVVGSASNVAWDIGSTSDGADDTATTVSIPGIKVGDVALVTPAAVSAGFVYSAYVSAANTVTLRAINAHGSTVDPASTTATVIVLRP